MDFRQLESFVLVVKYKSFTKAAKESFISQPTISNHISMLEKELGTKLIKRTTKNIEVTENGYRLYQMAANIIAMKDRYISSCNANEKKVITLGASTIPSAYLLPSILPKYKKLHPEVSFVINQNDSQWIARDLVNGEYDLAIIGMDFKGENIENIPIYEDEMVLITPNTKEYRDIDESIEIKDLITNKPIILRAFGSGSKKKTDNILSKLEIMEEDLLVVAKINDQETIKNMVSSGLGISIISIKAAKNFIDEKKVLYFTLPKEVAKRQISIIYSNDYTTKEYIKSFIEYLKKEFNK